MSRFEDVDLPARGFDAVFSATAFHWVDPAIGWRKVAGLLRPGGVLALLQSALPGLDPEEVEAWNTVVPEEARKWQARDPYQLWHGAELRSRNVSELWSWLVGHDLGRPEAADDFRDVQVLTSPRAHEERLEAYLDLLRTTSSYLRLDRERRQTLDEALAVMFDRAGGVRHWVGTATLVTAIRATAA